MVHFISTEPPITNLQCQHSYPEVLPGLIHPINYSHLILSRTIKKSCLWFWNSWSEFLNTTPKTQEDKFKDVSILKILFTKEKKRTEYRSTEGVKTPLKNGLGKEPILEHLPCQSIKMIISEDYSETLRIVKKCKLGCRRSLKSLI